MPKIVFVEDEVELCELYETLLSGSRFEVLTFKDDKSAIEYFKKETCDVCFLDYHIGEILGTDIRKSIPDDIKCVLVTGNSQLQLPLGFVSLINKPFDFESFNDLIENIIAK